MLESEALFRSQFEFGNIGIAITSIEKLWLHANPRLCEMLGYSEEELRRQTWAELTHPDDLAAGSAAGQVGVRRGGFARLPRLRGAC